MTSKAYEKVIIVGLQLSENDQEFEYSLNELKQLIENAGGEVVGELSQKRNKVDVKTFVGKGKLNELGSLVDELGVSTVVFNQELSPSQVRNIQKAIDVKVIDRIQVILDIFALRAQSKEGRLQVELAQLNYILPRLTGQGENMSRLGAGIGTRGPGETKLETDRRYINSRMTDIKNALKKIGDHRERSREKRQNSDIIQIGLIGYTNAGKSTVINSLTGTQTVEKNALFATLDPLTRQFELPSGLKVVITDTVGFIQDLPTQLIESFKSTLEETAQVDLLLHVVDSSIENRFSHEETVLSLMNDLEMDDIPVLTVYNKRDLVDNAVAETLYPNVVISAKVSEDIEKLTYEIEKILRDKIMTYYEHHIQADRGDLLVELMNDTLVESQKYNEEEQKYVVKGYAKKDSYWTKVDLETE